jgi:hypothetical protein
VWQLAEKWHAAGAIRAIFGGVLQLVIPPNYSIHHPRMNGYFGNHFGAILNLKV